jgi:zinc protease
VRKSSPLYRGLIASGLAAEARSFYVPTRDPFLHTISLTATGGASLEKIERKAVAILEEAGSRRARPRELRKAKNQIRATVVFQSDSVTELAHQIGYFHTVRDVSFFEGFLDRVEEVSAEEVRSLAERLFRPAGRTVGIYRGRTRREGARR